ncbi:MAG: peptidylprolyl isomerase [Thermoplasmata archaeon]|nr:peptidylprolyl isomerase [Candidatus Sysuiplasma acidicola]
MSEDAQIKADTEADDSKRISPGDIVQIELDAWINETGKLFQTTSKENAQKEEIYDDKTVYGPVFEIVGKNRFFPGLEKSMSTASIGQEVELLIKPEEGAGSRDQNLVKLYSVREFERMNVEPKVGVDVRIGDRVGRITQVTVGRVRVDFNNPLAGHTLKYRYKVLAKIEEPLEKFKAIAEMYYGTSSGFDIKIDGDRAVVILPDSCRLDPRWVNAKLRIVAEAYETIGLREIEFVEKYVKPAPPVAAVPEAKAEKAPEEITDETTDSAKENEKTDVEKQ